MRAKYYILAMIITLLSTGALAQLMKTTSSITLKPWIEGPTFRTYYEEKILVYAPIYKREQDEKTHEWYGVPTGEIEQCSEKPFISSNGLKLFLAAGPSTACRGNIARIEFKGKEVEILGRKYKASDVTIVNPNATDKEKGLVKDIGDRDWEVSRDSCTGTLEVTWASGKYFDDNGVCVQK